MFIVALSCPGGFPICVWLFQILCLRIELSGGVARVCRAFVLHGYVTHFVCGLSHGVVQPSVLLLCVV